MKADMIIGIYHTMMRSKELKAKLIFRDYGNYACLKLVFGKKGEHPVLWSKLYKSNRLLKKLDGIPFIYDLFKIK